MKESVPLISFGCSKKKDELPAESYAVSEPDTEAPAEGAVQSNAEGIAVSSMLELWETGQKGDAVKQFLSVKWNDPSVYREIPILTMSDKQWRSLPRDEQVRAAKDAQKQTIRLFKIVKDVVSNGKALASSGDAEMAKKHFEAVRHCGEALSHSKLLITVRDYGKVTIEYAQDQEKLSGIK